MNCSKFTKMTLFKFSILMQNRKFKQGHSGFYFTIFPIQFSLILHSLQDE